MILLNLLWMTCVFFTVSDNSDVTTIQLSKNTHQKAGRRLDISVVEKYGSTIISVTISTRENEQFAGGNLYIYSKAINRLANDKQLGRVPLFVAVNKDGQDKSLLQLDLTRELAAKCRLGIYIDKQAPDARPTKKHYIIDIGSYFPE